MFRKNTLSLFLFLLSISLSIPSYAVSEIAQGNHTILTTIVRYYDSWKECKSAGETIKENDTIYSLEQAYLLEGQSMVKAIYAIPTNLKITYSSLEKCKSVGESLVQNNITYYLTETEKINGTEKFLATYELKGIE